jgi:hypothetical protein
MDACQEQRYVREPDWHDWERAWGLSEAFLLQTRYLLHHHSSVRKFKATARSRQTTSVVSTSCL